MADRQKPCAEEVSDVLAEAYRPARFVEQIPALALLMATPTLHAPAREDSKPAANGRLHE